jgi:hypothetical protein
MQLENEGAGQKAEQKKWSRVTTNENMFYVH